MRRCHYWANISMCTQFLKKRVHSSWRNVIYRYYHDYAMCPWPLEPQTRPWILSPCWFLTVYPPLPEYANYIFHDTHWSPSLCFLADLWGFLSLFPAEKYKRKASGELNQKVFEQAVLDSMTYDNFHTYMEPISRKIFKFINYLGNHCFFLCSGSVIDLKSIPTNQPLCYGIWK